MNGETIEFAAVRHGDRGFVRLSGRTWRVSLLDLRQAAGRLGEGVDDIRAPMPGVVVSVHKREGDAVRRGEAVATLESMKLQIALAAPRDGIIAAISKQAEETVGKDEIVATLVAAGDAE